MGPLEHDETHPKPARRTTNTDRRVVSPFSIGWTVRLAPERPMMSWPDSAIWRPNRRIRRHRDLRCVLRSTINCKYVRDIEFESRLKRRCLSEALVFCDDNTACTSVRHASEPSGTVASWYRIIPPEKQKRLIILYKVRVLLQVVNRAYRSQRNFVRDTTNQEFFQSLFLSDVPKSVNLTPRHCFSLPTSNLSLENALDNPVHLRRSKITSLIRTVTVAYVSNSVMDLQIHEGENPPCCLGHWPVNRFGCCAMTKVKESTEQQHRLCVSSANATYLGACALLESCLSLNFLPNVVLNTVEA